MKNKLKGFIFDFDGTLVESMEMWETLIQKIFKKYGIAGFNDELIEKLEPLFISDMAVYLEENFDLGIDAKQILEDIDEIISKGYREDVYFKKGALEFLDKYKDMKMCIISTTDRKFIVEFLKQKGLLDRFEFVSCASESGKSKNYIDPYTMVRERLGFEKDEVVVFEDASYAIKTLKNNDYYVVCVEDDFAKDKEFNKKNSDQYVVDLNECVF